MLLLLDIGNTAVTYGIAKNRKLVRFGSVLFNDIPKLINKCSKSGSNHNINIVISSVVPKNTDKIVDLTSKNPRITCWVVGKNLQIPVKSKYHPKQLGVDRALNAYGATHLFKPPVLIIDYGTAVTFDYVSSSGVFEGGMIIPGPETSFQALIKKAALLPKNARLPHHFGSFLGRNTQDSLKTGVLQGYGAMTDGLIQRFRSRYGKMVVVGTGGFIQHLKPYITQIGRFEPRLSILSLLKLFQQLPRA